MAGKGSGAKQKQLEEHVATNEVNLQQVSNMIGHKKRTLERQSSSDIKMSTSYGTVSD